MGLYGDFMGYKVIYEIYIYLFKYPNQSDAWLRLKMEDLLPQMAILGGNIWLQNRWMAWGTLFSDTHICKQNKIWIYTHKFVDVYNHSHFFFYQENRIEQGKKN